MRVGTRGSPLALWQTRHFLSIISGFCPVLRDAKAFEEHVISTEGDRVQDRPLADIGGKGLFAKEIHEALLDGQVDFAVHSLKDLETELPPGIVLACTLQREDPRDAIILGPVCGAPDRDDPLACIPHGALVGTASVRRQSQVLAMRPDLRCEVIRGNIQTRLGRVRNGDFAASFLALAGLRRMGLEREAGVLLDPGDDAAGRLPGHRRRHGARRGCRAARAALGDRVPHRAHRRHGGTRPARRARWLLPHADRRLCDPAAGRVAVPDRADRPAGWRPSC